MTHAITAADIPLVHAAAEASSRVEGRANPRAASPEAEHKLTIIFLFALSMFALAVVSVAAGYFCWF